MEYDTFHSSLKRPIAQMFDRDAKTLHRRVLGIADERHRAAPLVSKDLGNQVLGNSISGNRAGFASVEWRFPLIDRIDMSFLSLGGVRGRLFVDVGTAWYDINGVEYNWFGEPGFKFMGEKELPDGTTRGESGRLTDGVASYGFGFSITVFGLPMHWDFIKLWDFKDTLDDTQVEFWIGYQF